MSIPYNFRPILSAISDMQYEYESRQQVTNKTLQPFRKELNKFFTDSNCVEIIYTPNDQLFFGMSVYPMMTPEMIDAVLTSSNKIRIDRYKLEIDSKLFDTMLNLTAEEFLAITLHECGHVINDSSIIEQMRDVIHVYIAKTNNDMKRPNCEEMFAILEYGINNSIRKMTSMFCIYKNGEVLADRFVYECGYGQQLQTAFDKICRNGFLINNNVKNKFVVLTWCIQLYTEIKTKRVPAIRTLQHIEKLTNSTYERRSIVKLRESLRSMAFINESARSEQRKKEYTLRDIKKYEQELYTYKLNARSLSDKNDALYLMRQINNAIYILEDLLYTSDIKLTSGEKQKYSKLLDEYYKLRDFVASESKFNYDYSNSVINISYPDIVPNRM